jgi:hypothetical protein
MQKLPIRRMRLVSDDNLSLAYYDFCLVESKEVEPPTKLGTLAAIGLAMLAELSPRVIATEG